MLQVNNVSLKFGKRTLFEDVNIKFTSGNCYGLIGANGSWKVNIFKNTYLVRLKQQQVNYIYDKG